MALWHHFIWSMQTGTVGPHETNCVFSVTATHWWISICLFVSERRSPTAVMGTSLSCLMMSLCTGMLGMWWTTICRQGLSPYLSFWHLGTRHTICRCCRCDYQKPNCKVDPHRKPVLEVVQPIHVVSSGGLRSSVSFTLRISDKSTIKQEIVMDAMCPYIKFNTEVRTRPLPSSWQLPHDAKNKQCASSDFRYSGRRLTSSSRWNSLCEYVVPTLHMRSNLVICRDPHTGTPHGTGPDLRYNTVESTMK